MKTAEIKKILGYHDGVTQNKDGIITIKRPYFYHAGRSIETLIKKVSESFPAADILYSEDKYGSKMSYLIVKFKLK